MADETAPGIEAAVLRDAPDKSGSVLEIRNVSKRFGQTQALDDVSVAFLPGEIHALLGENGAGKSTLIKIMTGVQQADGGEVIVDGQPVQIGNALEGQGHGIVAMYQEPSIFPDLSVAENVFISHRERGRSPVSAPALQALRLLPHDRTRLNRTRGPTAHLSIPWE